jgi:multidrug efflux pump subunit AcrB
MVVAFIGGTFGFLSLEKEAFPSADFNGASVSIAWPGASPQDVEDQIVVRLEEVVADIDGLKRLTGVAREGVGYVNLQTELDVDVDEFVDEVKRRVDTISNLPQSSFPPQVSRWSANNQFMGLALHGNVDPGTLDYYADEMRDRIALLEGGELAQVQGTLGEEVSIESFIIMDSILHFTSKFNENIEESVIWPELYNICVKYAPFLNVNKQKYVDILKKQVELHYA